MRLPGLHGRRQRRASVSSLLIVKAFEELMIEVLQYNPESETYEKRLELLRLLRGQSDVRRSALRTVQNELKRLQPAIDTIIYDQNIGHIDREKDAMLEELIVLRTKYEWQRDVLEDVFRIVNRVIHLVINDHTVSDDMWSNAVHGVARMTGWGVELPREVMDRFVERIKPVILQQERSSQA